MTTVKEIKFPFLYEQWEELYVLLFKDYYKKEQEVESTLFLFDTLLSSQPTLVTTILLGPLFHMD